MIVVNNSIRKSKCSFLLSCLFSPFSIDFSLVILIHSVTTLCILLKYSQKYISTFCVFYINGIMDSSCTAACLVHLTFSLSSSFLLTSHWTLFPTRLCIVSLQTVFSHCSSTPEAFLLCLYFWPFCLPS